MFTLFNHLPEVQREIAKAAAQLVRKAALDIEASAKARAAVDTGFMRSSIYTQFADGGDYGEGAETPPKGAELLPEVERPPDDHTAYVAVGANYGLYVEMGTSHSGAQPFLVPALEAERPAFEAAWGALERHLKGVP